jgi:hypothetical protein
MQPPRTRRDRPQRRRRPTVPRDERPTTPLVIVTAADAYAVFDLKWLVREAVVSDLQDHHTDASPHR